MNVALDQALIDSHRAGHSPDTLRFLEFSPSVLVGRHQDLSRELDLGFCRAHDIDVGRRVTGGGAIYLDQGQIGWEFVCGRASLGGGNLATLTARICTAAADGLARLGVEVCFRPRNDLEIDGRKVGGTGGFFDGDTVFYQGTVLIESTPGMMFGALRVGADKRARHAAEPAARITTLSEALGGRAPDKVAVKAALAAGFAAAFDLEYTDTSLSAAEEALAERLYAEEIGSEDFVHDIDDPTAEGRWRSATRDTPGGLVTVHLGLAAGRRPRIERVLFSGDFFITPPRLLYDLEQALVQVAVADVAACVAAFMATSRPEMLSVTPADLAAAIEAAAGA
ncbi:MAG: biotin/lipoate A/B protein ligase family protein [Gammaproteobacteria bacterium]